MIKSFIKGGDYMKYVLETFDIMKRYKHSIVLEKLNMHVPNGSIYGLIGRNGAGKTTLIRLLCGLQQLTSGEYKIYGIKNTDSNTLKAELTNRFESESAELKKQEKSLKKFCRQTGRRYESARTQVHAVLDSEGNIVGFNKSVAQKAVWASKRHTSKMQMAKQLNKLSDEERLAVQRYTGFAAHRVNRALYSGKSQMIEKDREYMKVLDSALDKGVIERKIVVHRDTIPEFLNVFPKGFKYSEHDMERLVAVSYTHLTLPTILRV